MQATGGARARGRGRRRLRRLDRLLALLRAARADRRDDRAAVRRDLVVRARAALGRAARAERRPRLRTGGRHRGRAFVLAKLVVAARFNRTVRDVALTFLMTRLPLLAIAELAAMVIGQRPGVHYAASTNPLLAVWRRWDAEHYLYIAKFGYSGTEAAFFPLYPLLLRIAAALTGSQLSAGLIISNAASFLAMLYLYKLIEHEYNRHVAQRATFYVSIFPTAIFFSAVYSESLFLFLTVASFYYVRERRWVLAGAFGFLAALTRSEGVLLAAPLFIEWVIAAKEGGREFFRYWVDDVVKPLIGMTLVPLGLAA